MGALPSSSQSHFDGVVDPTVVAPEDEGSDWEIAVVEDEAKVVMPVIMCHLHTFWGKLEKILKTSIIEGICVLVMQNAIVVGSDIGWVEVVGCLLFGGDVMSIFGFRAIDRQRLIFSDGIEEHNLRVILIEVIFVSYLADIDRIELHSVLH